MSTFIPSKYKYLKINEIKPKGWIYRHLMNDVNGFSGHLDELCSEAGSDIFGLNKIGDKVINGWWNGETEGNWIDGFIRLAYMTGDKKSIMKAEDYMTHILDTQSKDGYIGVYKEGFRFGTEGDNGELWTQSRIFLAMLAFYEATGNKEILEAVKKAALLTIIKYGPSADGRSYFENHYDGYIQGKMHGLMFIEPMILLYEITEDERFLDFAKFCYDDYSFNILTWDGADCQLGNLLDENKHFIGHGPHTCEHIRIPLMIYYYTGDEKYKKAYENGFEKLKRYTVISGTVKSDEYIGSENYTCVPLPAAGYEYCTITEQLLSLHTAAQLTGKPEYADMAERLLHNSAQAARRYDGKAIAYLSSDNQYIATRDFGIRWDYSPTHDDAAVCCIPNAGRLMPYQLGRMWMREGSDCLCPIYYGPCTVETIINDIMVRIDEITEYPFRENITFKISLEGQHMFSLKFRVPGWSLKTSIFINDIEVQQEIEKGFITLKREWSDKDEIKLEFVAGITVEKAIDGTVAIVRGPLVYSLRISETATVSRLYDLPGFCDTDYRPSLGACWDYTLKIDTLDENLGFKVSRLEREEDGLLWDKPPIMLKSGALDWKSAPADITLVPIGCTILRRTCFNYVDTGNEGK